MAIAVQTRGLDRLAIGLSGFCLVHCLATAVLLGVLSAAGGLLGSPFIHEVGLGLATIGMVTGIVVGVMAGALSLPHNGNEALYTIIGVGVLALGHQLNSIAGE